MIELVYVWTWWVNQALRTSIHPLATAKVDTLLPQAAPDYAHVSIQIYSNFRRKQKLIDSREGIRTDYV